MNKKTIISLLIGLLVLAGIVYGFTKWKGTKTTKTTTTTTEQVSKNGTKTTTETVKTVNVKKYALGDYGSLKSFIKKDLSNVDKKALQTILNDREVALAKYQGLINAAKAVPNADKGAIEAAIDNYNATKTKFDAKLKVYMSKDMATKFVTAAKAEAKDVMVKAYAK